MQHEDRPTIPPFLRRADAVVSGGRMRAFEHGWAVAIFTGEKAHLWTRNLQNISEATSRCGLMVLAKSLLGAGDYPRCKRCASAREDA